MYFKGELGMCNCIKEKEEKLKSMFGSNCSINRDVLTGRVLLPFKVEGKKQNEYLLLSRCPFCGEEYNN